MADKKKFLTCSLFAISPLISLIAPTTTSKAAFTALALFQGAPGNLITDGTRVYWIDFQNAKVSSVPVNGGSVFVHSPVTPSGGGDIRQVSTSDPYIYFSRW